MANENFSPVVNAFKGEMEVRYYAVCLIDLLGQKDNMAQWENLPPTSQPPLEFIQALKQTAGTVMDFRGMFHDFFYKLTRPVDPLKRVVVTQEQKNLHRRYMECSLGIQHFSDAFVFYTPLGNSFGDVSTNGMFRILAACSMAMICSLSQGRPLRGGVCIGTGLELAENDFYGPVLAEAYHLESKCAGYPRIIVSEKAKKFLHSVEPFSINKTIDKSMKNLATTCQSLICCDSDGKVIVDYLGKGMREIAIERDTIKTIWKAYDFVRSEKDNFIKSGNVKLAGRYVKLEQYMAQRVPDWNNSEVLDYGR